MTNAFVAPPLGVGIQLVEASSERMIIAIPPGGSRTRSLGCFALIWTTVMTIISTVLLVAGLTDSFVDVRGKAPSLWIVIPFFSLFWAAGIGLTYAWFRMRFTRVLLSVEPHRFAVQRDFLGRKKVDVLELDSTAVATLEEAYSENDVPVHRICVSGIGRQEKFGTGLSAEEKDWLVESINAFLHPESHAAESDELSSQQRCPECNGEMTPSTDGLICESCGHVMQPTERSNHVQKTVVKGAPGFGGRYYVVEEHVPELEPENLPADSLLRVDTSDPDRLRVILKATRSRVVKLFVGLFFGTFCTIWYGISIGALVHGLLQAEGFDRLMFLLIPLVFIAVGLVPLGILVFVLFGRVTITVDAERLTARLHAGPIGKEKSVSVGSILDVGIGRLSPRSISQQSRRHPTADKPSCIVLSSEFSMPLTSGEDPRINSELAGLVGHRLRQVGHPLSKSSD